MSDFDLAVVRVETASAVDPVGVLVDLGEHIGWYTVGAALSEGVV